VIRLVNIQKRFGGVEALRGAELAIPDGGVVVGLAGENGSGKTTMLNILAGYLAADAGEIEIDGQLVHFHHPRDALRKGIVMVSQETAIVPTLSVAENILLGRRLVRGKAGLSWRRTHARAREVLQRLGLSYDTTSPVGSLRPDQRQMVEIARALSMEARVLILDEPTSSLTDDEVQALMHAVRLLKDRGVATIFVSHRIREVFRICDAVTVLRDGHTVSTGSIANYDNESLVEALVGSSRRLTSEAANLHGVVRLHGEPGLSVRGISAEAGNGGVTFDVRRGEIVGLAGLVGAGRSELLEMLFGVRPIRSGSVCVRGRRYEPKSPRAAIAAGIGYLPPERRAQGLVLTMSVAGNVSMVAEHRRFRWLPPDRRGELRTVHALIRDLGLRTPAATTPVSALSGGNQQKVALSKWLLADPAVLLLDEPTRGVDVAAKSEIHALLRKTAEQGTALLVSSSEYDELIELCDRVLVMFRGEIAADLAAKDATEALVAHHAGGSET
jgi:ABC-type sugar transport system ATPase subunit